MVGLDLGVHYTGIAWRHSLHKTVQSMRIIHPPKGGCIRNVIRDVVAMTECIELAMRHQFLTEELPVVMAIEDYYITQRTGSRVRAELSGAVRVALTAMWDPPMVLHPSTARMLVFGTSAKTVHAKPDSGDVSPDEFDAAVIMRAAELVLERASLTGKYRASANRAYLRNFGKATKRACT